MEAAKSSYKGVPFAQNNPAPESKLHFLDYWRIIRIRKTVILAVFLLVVITTTAVTFLLPETFMSTATIEVQKEANTIRGLIDLQAPTAMYDPYFIQTEFEKIRARPMLEKVVQDLTLHQAWAKRLGYENLKVSDACTILDKQIDLRNSRNTTLIEIRAFSDVREEAKNIAQKFAEVYKDKRLAVTGERSRAGIEALKSEFESQSAKVDEAQKNVDKLRREQKISDVGDMTFTAATVEPEIVRMLERQRVEIEMQYTQIDTILKKLQETARAELRDVIPTAYPDEALQRLLSELSTAKQRYQTLITDFSEEHPEVQRIAGLIRVIDEQVESKISGILRGLEVAAESKRQGMEKLRLRVEAAKLADAESREAYAPYFAAKRDLETQQRIRDTIYMRILQETVDSKLPQSSLVEIVNPAQVPTRAVRPNIPLNIALGVVVGLIMGFGLAFFIEYLDTSVKTIDDVERALQAPVLGVIPQNVGSLLQEGVDSPHAEAYRVLRTNLLFARKTEDMRTITVVSGGAGEGKSTTIFNLATIFAQNGARVLLVDSDLRRPSLHKLLNVSNSLGLTNFLLKQNTLDEVVQTTAHALLHFLPSGKLPSSSLGILNSTEMRNFINAAKERYDYVFFDSPPIMGVSDASILASEVDMALLVIQYRKYPQVMTIRAKQMVEKVGGNLLGVVLNNINISQDSYYYYYSGYYYDYYSKQEDDSKGKTGRNGSAKNGATGTANQPAKSDRGAAVDVKQKY